MCFLVCGCVIDPAPREAGGRRQNFRVVFSAFFTCQRKSVQIQGSRRCIHRMLSQPETPVEGRPLFRGRRPDFNPEQFQREKRKFFAPVDQNLGCTKCSRGSERSRARSTQVAPLGLVVRDGHITRSVTHARTQTLRQNSERSSDRVRFHCTSQ